MIIGHNKKFNMKKNLRLTKKVQANEKVLKNMNLRYKTLYDFDDENQRF